MPSLRLLGSGDDPRAAELAHRLDAALGPVLVRLVLPVVLDVLGDAPAETPAIFQSAPALLTVAEAAERLGIG